MSLAFIVLAAGASSRMRGADKLMQTVRGKPLILDRLDLFGAYEKHDVIVVLPPDRSKRNAALTGSAAAVVVNKDAATGMASSIKAGLAAVPDHATAALFLPADMPDITSDDIHTLEQAHQQQSGAIIRAATQDLTPGNPVIFPRALFAPLQALTGDQSGRDVLKANRTDVQLVPLPGARARLDLDTPEDWAAWRADNPLL